MHTKPLLTSKTHTVNQPVMKICLWLTSILKVRVLLFSVFLASSLHKKYIKSHNDYLVHSTVHFVFWRSPVQRQFHRICMVTRFSSVRYISLKVRFYSVMLTRTLNKLEVLTQLFSFLCFVVIFRLSLVGVVFEGISMLANAPLLWSYCSVSSGP